MTSNGDEIAQPMKKQVRHNENFYRFMIINKSLVIIILVVFIIFVSIYDTSYENNSTLFSKILINLLTNQYQNYHNVDKQAPHTPAF